MQTDIHGKKWPHSTLFLDILCNYYRKAIKCQSVSSIQGDVHHWLPCLSSPPFFAKGDLLRQKISDPFKHLIP